MGGMVGEIGATRLKAYRGDREDVESDSHAPSRLEVKRLLI
jgi:hypothetical protein